MKVYSTYFSDLNELSIDEQLYMDKINRVKVGCILDRWLCRQFWQTETGRDERPNLLKEIERFIFINFGYVDLNRTSGSSHLSSGARSIQHRVGQTSKPKPIEEVIGDLRSRHCLRSGKSVT